MIKIEEIVMQDIMVGLGALVFIAFIVVPTVCSLIQGLYYMVFSREPMNIVTYAWCRAFGMVFSERDWDDICGKMGFPNKDGNLPSGGGGYVFLINALVSVVGLLTALIAIASPVLSIVFALFCLGIGVLVPLVNKHKATSITELIEKIKADGRENE